VGPEVVLLVEAWWPPHIIGKSEKDWKDKKKNLHVEINIYFLMPGALLGNP